MFLKLFNIAVETVVQTFLEGVCGIEAVHHDLGCQVIDQEMAIYSNNVNNKIVDIHWKKDIFNKLMALLHRKSLQTNVFWNQIQGLYTCLPVFKVRRYYLQAESDRRRFKIQDMENGADIAHRLCVRDSKGIHVNSMRVP